MVCFLCEVPVMHACTADLTNFSGTFNRCGAIFSVGGGISGSLISNKYWISQQRLQPQVQLCPYTMTAQVKL